MLPSPRKVVLPPCPAYPLHVAGNCYTYPGAATSGPDAVTLVLLHSSGFHKEMFEPTIEELFGVADAASQSGAWTGPALRIRDVWVVECPTHGESAVLNEAAIRTAVHDESFNAEEYARAACHLLTSTGEGGANIDFTNTKLVGLGHSLGGVSMIFLSEMLPKFSSLFIIDPTLFVGLSADLAWLQQTMLRRAYERKDVWFARESAYKYLRARAPKWDDRVVKLFIKHGIRDHPAQRYLKARYLGVTLACPRNHEATMYRDVEGPAEDILDAMSRQIPVHMVFGDIPDTMPRFIQEKIAYGPSRNFSSVTWMKDIGHLIPQEAPQQFAQLIYSTLSSHRPGERAML